MRQVSAVQSGKGRSQAVKQVQWVMGIAGIVSATSLSAATFGNGLPFMSANPFQSPFGMGSSPFSMLNPWGGSSLPLLGGGFSPFTAFSPLSGMGSPFGGSPFSSMMGSPFGGSPWGRLPMVSGMGNPFGLSPYSMYGLPGYSPYGMPAAPALSPYASNPYAAYGVATPYPYGLPGMSPMGGMTPMLYPRLY